MTPLTRWRTGRRERPAESFSESLQHERTNLAWERTAIALMVASTLLARYAASDGVWVVAGVAFALAAVGGGLLVWGGVHYDDLHEPLRTGGEIDHHIEIKLVAATAVAVAGTALLLALWLTLGR
mgnify:CR=1 FL=1